MRWEETYSQKKTELNSICFVEIVDMSEEVYSPEQA